MFRSYDNWLPAYVLSTRLWYRFAAMSQGLGKNGRWSRTRSPVPETQNQLRPHFRKAATAPHDSTDRNYESPQTVEPE